MSLRSFLLASFLSLLSTTCLGENRIANIHEGTNIAVALPPNGDTLVIDLIGQLWQFPLSGGAANPLTPSTAIARNPRFSPDGTFLVYQSEETSQWDLWLLDVEKGIQHQLTNTPHNEVEPDFSANGSSVVFSSNLAGSYDIWEINIESGNLTQLTSSSGKASFPSVSERGEIAYVNERNGRWSLELLRGEISTELFSRSYPLRAPSWRPGGGVIIFNERPNPGQSNLMMILLDTDPLTKTLTSGEDVFGFRPAWLSPGEFVYTADGGVWRRRLASTTRQAIQFFAGVTVTRPSYPRRTVDFDRPGSGAVAAEPYVIQVDRLFDGIRNQYRRHMDVHVDGQRITDVVTRGLKPLPSRVIDARGYTLIPGLIDLHTHTTNLPDERLGRAWLSYGVTTIREVETNPSQWEASSNRQPAWSANPRAGPRLILTAPVITQSDKPVIDLGSEFAVFQISRGQPEQFTSRSINNVRELGIPIFGQTLFPAARFGIDGLEHIGSTAERPYSLERSELNRSYQDIFSVLIETRTVVIPALVAFGGFQALVENDPDWARDNAYVRLFSPAERAQWEAPVDSREQLINLQKIVAQLIQAGGRVAAGSDSPTSPYGLGLHAELALLSEAGIPNDQILRLVTSGAALALGIERDLGTIEPGKLADFVVLSGNPLTRIQDSLRIEAVVKDGLWTARNELLAEP
jgi:hypothetical protein